MIGKDTIIKDFFWQRAARSAQFMVFERSIAFRRSSGPGPIPGVLYYMAGHSNCHGGPFIMRNSARRTSSVVARHIYKGLRITFKERLWLWWMAPQKIQGVHMIVIYCDSWWDAKGSFPTLLYLGEALKWMAHGYWVTRLWVGRAEG